MYKQIKNTQQEVETAVGKILDTISKDDIDNIDKLSKALNVDLPSIHFPSVVEQGALKRRIEKTLTEKVIKEHYPGLLPAFKKGKNLPANFEIKIEMRVDEEYKADIDTLLFLVAKTTKIIDKLNFVLNESGFPKLGEQLVLNQDKMLKELFPAVSKRKVEILEDLKKALQVTGDHVANDQELDEIIFALREDKGLFRQYLKLK